MPFYFAYNNDNEGTVFLAPNHKWAKRYAWKHFDWDSWLDIRIRIVKPSVLVPYKFKFGEVPEWFGLFYDLYSYIYENCPFCHKNESFRLDGETESIVICSKCNHEIKESDVNQYWIRKEGIK